MVAVKKVGLASDIIPSLEELYAIKNIKMAALRIIERKSWKARTKRDKADRTDWDLIVEEWFKIKFNWRSKTQDLSLGQGDLDRLNNMFHQYKLQKARRIDSRILGIYFAEKLCEVWGSQFDTPERLFSDVQQAVQSSESVPVELSILGLDNDWIFKGYRYATEGLYSEEQFKLLIFEAFDKERRHFERLKSKYESVQVGDDLTSRSRIPESVRIEVWRRDGGKCVRCGSRERLEYDHIIPVSKGGSDTARNIELLCEKCNREKSDKIE